SNLGLFDVLGIGAAFDAIAGAPLHRVAWCFGDSTIDAPLPPFADGDHPWGRVLGREHLDTLLRDRASELGATIMQPCTVRKIERIADGHCCIVSDPEGTSHTLESSIVIDAHGSWQRDPFDDSEAARPRKVRGSDLFAFKANFSGAQLAQGVLPVLAFDGGYGGMVQGDHGLLTLACCIRHDRLQQRREDAVGAAAGDVVQALLESEVRAVRQALVGAIREGAWLAVGPVRPRIAIANHGAGRFAVGNAAGEAHPILGEGISMAVQSAFMLCARLIEGNHDVDSYRKAWRRAFAPRIRFAELYAHIAMRPTLTRIALPALKRWPKLLSLGARLGGKARCAVDPERILRSRQSAAPQH
ncbi:MAG: hypothetical protein ABI451_13045, partial [Dokdonella sp.]